jgi:hypothetical protein
MPQSPSSVDTALANAKAALAHADAKFPRAAAAAPAAKPAAPAAPSIGAELKAKSGMVGKARQALDAPKMHKGGPVPADGIYTLKKGEHVLTEKEVGTVKKHALMATGLKSLAATAKKK